MEAAEYELMHAVEDRMWWYRGLRALAGDLLGGALVRANVAGFVLDAGCGTGGMLRTLGPEVAGRPTVGLEYDARAVALAAAKARRPVVAGSVNEMPFATASLAAYISLDMLSHGGVDPSLALREAHRCLRRGAIAVFNLPAYSWLLSTHDRRVHNARRFTRGQVHALLKHHRFTILRSSYWNTLVFPLMLLHRLLERDDAASDVRDYPRWLDALLYAAVALERAAIAAGLRLPFGGSVIVVAARND